MKKNQELYDFLKNVRAPRYKNDSLQRHLKNKLYRIIDQTDSDSEKSRGVIWKHRLALVFAGSGLVCALILTLFFMFSPLFFGPDSAYPSLMASSLCGDVTAVYNEEPVALKVGEKLKPGITLTVAEGASCDVSINKISLLRLAERSVITLDERENMLTVRLVRGTLIGHIKKPDRPLDLRLVTDNCIIGIKSTTFIVRAEENRVTRIALLEGKLSIKTKSNIADKEYILQSGRELELTLDSTEISTTPLSAGHRAALLQVQESNLASFTDSEQTATCEIQPEPADATISVNGQNKGKGKLTFLVAKGREIKLKVTRPDYASHESIIRIDEDKTLHIMLKKEHVIESEDTRTLSPGDEESLEVYAEDGGIKTVSRLKHKTISIDGKINDWQSLQPVVRDPAGDIDLDTPEADITYLFMAKNNDTLFSGIKFAGGNISDLMAIEYRIDIMKQNKRILSIIMSYTDRQLRIVLEKKNADNIEAETSAIGAVAGGQGIIEAAIPLSAVDGYLSPGTVYSCRVTSRIPKNQSESTVVDETGVQEFVF
ncbi:MAG: PEGA domain-containing protein [Spirochaetales bacterium]|nr:PEGA domain-containing protein [Spirochaetales bacterium]